MIMIQVVKIILFDIRGNILLLQTKDRDWELPGGKVDPGENLLSAIVREVEEETKIYVNRPRKLKVIDGCQLYISPVRNNKVIVSKEHRNAKWVPGGEIPKYNLTKHTKNYLSLIIDVYNQLTRRKRKILKR